MKKSLSTFILALSVSVSAIADIGTLKNGSGKLFDEPNFKVVKKALNKGDTIPSHDHKGYTVLFTVTKGEVPVILNQKETHLVKVGDVLRFGGEDFIETDKLNQEAEILVTLVKDGSPEAPPKHDHKH